MADIKERVLKALKSIVPWSDREKMIRYEDIEKEVLKHHPDADIQYLASAYAFGAQHHHGQLRKSGEPYYSHPVAVAYILAKNGLDLETVASGFLHDVVEDCEEVSLKDLEERFGHNLAKIVDGVTKIGKVKYRNKLHAQADSYRKMILAMAEDLRVLIVKLADRYHNMQTLHHLPKEKQVRIARETMDIYAPLAHRVGMSHFKFQLEKLAFFYINPEVYVDIETKVNERHSKAKARINSTEKKIIKLLEEHNIKADVKSRIKSLYSIYKKMKNKKTGLDGIYDYYAFRIIAESVSDCYNILGRLHGRWHPIPDRIKDFIATPKPNLYQSLHTTLAGQQGQPFEVQIRTKTMDRIAEDGVAAHWTYKQGRLQSIGTHKYSKWLKKLVTDRDPDIKGVDYIESIKGDLVPNEILVFTPTGEIKTLKSGATVLDFAYHIHTDLGHRTTGGRVDGAQVGMRTKLKNGQTVEILTSKKQKPSEEWLSFAVTSSARSKIRNWLNSEKRHKSIEIGRALFEKEIKKMKIPLKTVSNKVIQEKLGELNFKKMDDFYSAIGLGNMTPRRAILPFVPEEILEKTPSSQEVRENRIKKAISNLTRHSKQQVIVKDLNDVLVFLSTCCKPIEGDPICGYITLGKGVAIHRKDCKSLKDPNLDKDRLVEDVQWGKMDDTQYFNTRLVIHTEDRQGMIADITNKVASMKTNIKDFEAHTDYDRGLGVIVLVVEVQSVEHLKKLSSALEQIKGVISVERRV
ncbi:MAG: hypothetical protein CR997_08135 [Acidobacteria bacterium]|nr:MAG: hypothetical protein CR997_08135 [Acidobacteriota bacterium]